MTNPRSPSAATPRASASFAYRSARAALLFFLAKNAALIAWARHGLHRDLRLEDNVDSKVKIAVIAQVPLPNC